MRSPGTGPTSGIAVRREGEGAVDPPLHSHPLQHRVAAPGHLEFAGDAIDLLRNQVEAVLPRRPVDVPVLVIDLVDADQHALLVLSDVGEPLEVHRHRHLEVERRDFGDGLGHEVVVLERRQRKVESHHPPHLLGPQATRVDDVLGMDDALLGHHLPGAVGALVQRLHLVVFDDRGAALARCTRVGMNGSGGVDVALTVRPQSADDPGDVHDRALLSDLLRRHQVAVLDADGLEDPVRRL